MLASKSEGHGSDPEFATLGAVSEARRGAEPDLASVSCSSVRQGVRLGHGFQTQLHRGII